ncbi:MAG TPA: PAS domain S-box protein [Chitinophagaceae bacterium]
MKSIIHATARRSELYLALMDEEGVISCANATMLKSFGLGNPRSAKTSFFDLVHPVHINDFKKTVQHAAQQKGAAAMELYIKNGYYHPMKWQVNYLDQQPGSKNIYFCIGYKIIDDDRLEKFNRLVKKHYQLIMEGLTGIIFHDKNGELVAVNQKIASLLNISMERLYQLKDISSLWKTRWVICNEEGVSVPFERSPFMKAVQTGKAQNEILVLKLENGETRSLLFNSQPLMEEDTNGDCSVVSSIVDVTNEKMLVERLREKNALLDAFVRQLPNLVWVVDEDSRLMLASDSFYNYFGLNEQQCLNKRMSDMVPASVYKTFYDKHVAVLESGKPMKFVEKARFADGTKYISHITIFPADGFNGKKLIGGYAVNLPDTTRIETELREANQRLLTLNQAATNAIWEWDMQTGRIFRNEALMEMIGYQADDSKGLSWWLRGIHPEDRDRVSDKVKEATDNYQHSWQDEYRFKCADGQYKHIQDKGFVIYENGLPVKMIGSLHDISALKELENKLADERLQRQKEMSETVIRVQEKERTRIGHELHDNVNQLLSTTMLFIDMLTTDGKEQKQIKSKSIEYIKTAIEEIRKLSKELAVPHFKKQGLVDSIHSLIEDIHLAHAIKIKFTHDLESDLLSSGKKITLFRIIQEQLKNILKHSKARKAEILLQIRHDDVQLVIKDDGVGFDSKLTHQGIGLSNIYERVSFYNGKVDIETAPRKGCIVTVTLSLL